MFRIIVGSLALLALLWSAPFAAGQSLSQRIETLHRDRGRRGSARAHGGGAMGAAGSPRRMQRSIAGRMHRMIEKVHLDHAPARKAFGWWSNVAGVPLVVNWRAMVSEGVNPQAPITLRLRHVPADRLLELMLRTTAASSGGAAVGVSFVYNIEPGFVQVLTKAQANRRPVVRVYDVRDLLVRVPDFTDAPRFDLRSALSNTNSGGGGRGGGGGGNGGNLFGQQEQPSASGNTSTRRQRLVRLTDVIRDSIEPTLWRAHGGRFASIRAFRGRLVVRAPKYVQRQIGLPTHTSALPLLGRTVTPSAKSGAGASAAVKEPAGGTTQKDHAGASRSR